MISVLEAVPIYRYLQRKGRWTEALKTKLKDTSDKQYGASFETWLFAMIPCPLLDGKNHCMGYEVRPLICRTYYATSNPDYCHPHKLGDGTEIVGRSEVVEKYHERQEQVLRHHRLRFSALPIGKALLLAERVCTGRMDLESVDSEVLAEYVEKA
jgi:Fe-S-cluster containining protein